MKRRFSLPPLVALVLTLACARANNARDSQIGRTTYDGSESMEPPRRATPPPAVEEEETDEDGTRVPDVVYVPTPEPVVDKMLELARVAKDDVVYDLGCGDGRIVVTAAKRYGARAVGFDIDPERVEEARRNVSQNAVDHLVTIEQRDIFTLDLSPATVVTLYLLPELNDRLLPQLERLRPGSRVVSHDYDFTEIVPVEAIEMRPAGENREHSIFLYTVPFERSSG